MEKGQETTLEKDQRKRLEDMTDGFTEIMELCARLKLSRRAKIALNFVDDLKAVTQAVLSLDNTLANLMIQVKGDPRDIFKRRP